MTTVHTNVTSQVLSTSINHNFLVLYPIKPLELALERSKHLILIYDKVRTQKYTVQKVISRYLPSPYKDIREGKEFIIWGVGVP